MRALVIDKFGPPDVLRLDSNFPRPSLREGQVLIRVHAASLNPLDARLREGQLKWILGAKFPMVLGHDAAGEVVECADRVNGIKVGDRVYGMLDANERISCSGFAKSGTYAEYAVTRADVLAPLPQKITFAEAATIPMCALTALQALVHKANLQSGQKVLINGASGGVGVYAIQIARTLGAEVTGVCNGKNLDFVRELGATRVIDYTKDNLSVLGEDYDVIYDVAATLSYRKIQKILTAAGIFVSNIAPLPIFLFPFLRRRTFSSRKQFVWVEPNGADLTRITQWMNQGLIRPVLDRTYPLKDAREAMRYLERNGARGKIAISID